MTPIELRLAQERELARIVALDDQTAALFERAGLSFAHMSNEHPYVVREHATWLRALERGDGWIAMVGGDVAGFMILDTLDGAPYLEQLSVALEFMRRGVGGTLLRHASSLCAAQGSLWLTTYGHLPWNRPYYERFGFERVWEEQCGPQIRAMLDAQRAALPAPEHRVAMRKLFAA